MDTNKNSTQNSNNEDCQNDFKFSSGPAPILTISDSRQPSYTQIQTEESKFHLREAITSALTDTISMLRIVDPIAKVNC